MQEYLTQGLGDISNSDRIWIFSTNRQFWFLWLTTTSIGHHNFFKLVHPVDVDFFLNSMFD